jgi:hypothetical protein
MKKPAKIKRRVPFVDVITVGIGDTSVEWVIDGNENTEFEILFPPGRDPLVPDTNISTGHKLERKIDPNVPRGQKKHYPYKIKLLRTNEEVESNSPPDMIIE